MSEITELIGGGSVVEWSPSSPTKLKVPGWIQLVVKTFFLGPKAWTLKRIISKLYRSFQLAVKSSILGPKAWMFIRIVGDLLRLIRGAPSIYS